MKLNPDEDRIYMSNEVNHSQKKFSNPIDIEKEIKECQVPEEFKDL